MVVPVAPFATDADRLVLPLDGVALGVERDETPVELLADGRTERDVEIGDPVDLLPARSRRSPSPRAGRSSEEISPFIPLGPRERP